MALCLTAGAITTRLAIAAFTLAWTHSVEKVAWQEDWRIEGDRLVLVESRIKGSGAGMEPGPGAVLEGGWYSWQPGLAVPELVLARSDAVPDWRLCAGGVCNTLAPAGDDAGIVVMTPCP